MSRIVPSVQKAIRVLDLIAERAPATLSLKAISTELALPKTTALAICVTLTEGGMIDRVQDGSYRLGPHSVALASRYLSGSDPVLNLDGALRVVPELQDQSMVISILDGTDVVYIACRTGTQAIALQYRVGMRLPSYCASSGKAILSRLPEQEVVARLGRCDLRIRSSGERKSLDDLLRELRQAREEGYARDDEEVARGMCCFGAPICNRSGSPVAAVSVSWVKAAIEESQRAVYAEAIVRLAKQLSAGRDSSL